MKKILIFLLISVSYTSFSQDFDNYKLVKANDKIPQDLITLSSDIYEKERKDISQKEKRFVKKAKDEFFLESSFEIHDMLYSGKIIFNDPLTKYVEKVAKEVFKSEPELNQKIQVFVMKSTEVNAFATNNGMIFITMGLLAQLENEAQLAFILAHEFTHYKKKHVMTGYVETQKIKRGKTGYKKMSYESRVEARYKFSKDQETEADIDGLEMYLKTNYSLKVLNGVFDVLEYEYLPFDDIEFDKTFFNTQNLILPKEYFKETTKNISSPTELEENADAKSTHPSIYKRRKYIADKISNQDNSKKSLYVVSETQFINVRKIARFELSQLYLNNQRYIYAIYNSYLLLKETPKSSYLRKNIGKSLYALAKYKNKDNISNLEFPIADSVEGSSQNVYFLIEKLTPAELSTLTMKYLWDLKKQYSNDNEIKVLVEDLIVDAVNNDIIKKADYSTLPKKDVAVVFKKEMDIVDTRKVLSKYDKIKKSQKIQKIQETSDTTKSFSYFALVDEMNDPEFLKLFDKALEDKSKKDESNLSIKEKADKHRAERQLKLERANRVRKKGEALAIDKIVFINPHYAKVDEREEKSLQRLESEEAQLELNDYIRELAPKAGLNIEMIDDIGLKSEEVEKFNDFGYLSQWFDERAAHIDNNMNLVSLDKNNVDYLVNKYQTKYFCWTGFIGEREQGTFKAAYILAGLYLYPLMPYFVYLALKPEYETIFYSIVFDIETGKAIYTNVSSMNYRDTSPLKRAHLYDIFYQMKQKTN